jgi:internalin A
MSLAFLLFRSGNGMVGSPLPPTVGLLHGLEVINLSKNKIVTLTNHLKSAAGLLTLDLSWNSLTELPPPVTELPSLTKLDVSNNHITALPASLGRMTSLEYLDISTNAIVSFIDNTSGLVNLRHLFMYKNRLKTLPVAFAPVLARLLSFDCSRNPLLVGDLNIDGVGALLVWCF